MMVSHELLHYIELSLISFINDWQGKICHNFICF